MVDHSNPHLLSFVTDATGTFVSIHADLRGITLLIEELQALQTALELDDCPHSHLFPPPIGELTQSKIANKEGEDKVVSHVKIYGWNEEWAVRHGLKPPADQ